VTPKRLFLWLAISSLAIAGLLGIAAIALPDMRFTAEVLASVTCLGVASLLCLLLAHARSKHTGPLIRRAIDVGYLATAAAFAVWMIIIWGDSAWLLGSNEGTWKLVAILSACSVTITHIAIVTCHAAINPTRGVQLASSAGAVVAGATFIIAILNDGGDILWRIFGAGLILAVACGTIAFILWMAIPGQRLRRTPVSARPTFTVRVRCPRCNADQPIPVGGPAHCPGCDLAIRIDIGEPTCACGYPILGLAADACPECGAAVPDTARWALAAADPAPSETPSATADRPGATA